MNVEGLMDKFNYALPLLVAGITTGALISLMLWPPSRELHLDLTKYLKRGKVIVTTTFVAILVIMLIRRIQISEGIVAAAIFCALVLLLLRLARINAAHAISGIRLNLLTLSDLLILIVATMFFRLWFRTMLSGHVFSAENVFGLPIVYSLIGTYMVYNCNLISCKKVKLATWRLLSYAFPEGKKLREEPMRKPQSQGPDLTDLIGWGLTLLVSFAGWLFGYWLAGHVVATVTYLALAFLVIIVIITRKGRRVRLDKAFFRKAREIAIGTGIVIALVCVLIIVTKGRFLFSPNTEERAMLALGIDMPLVFCAVEFVPDIPSQLWHRLTKFLEHSRTYEAIRSVAHSARITLFSQQTTKTTQAVLVAGIFLLYFVLPRAGQLFRAIGLEELNGEPISAFLKKFEEIAFVWTLPKSGRSDELIKFIFGNQGLVLLFLAWSYATLIPWIDVPSRLKKVPNLCKSRLSSFFWSTHILLFYFYFLPSLLIVALFIPIAASFFMGYALAVILSVFTFGLVLPRIEAYLLSLVYLIVTIINTNTKRDTVSINLASVDELMLLPGVGVKLAKRIIEERPYKNMNDLKRIEGLSRHKLNHIEALIRI